jgi:flagellar biosynthesis GTPase FlhF
LDETNSLGAALSFLAQSEIPLAYTSNGPHIPEDIAVGRGDALVQQAMKMMGGQFAKAALSDLTKEQEFHKTQSSRYSESGASLKDNKVMDL